MKLTSQFSCKRVVKTRSRTILNPQPRKLFSPSSSDKSMTPIKKLSEDHLLSILHRQEFTKRNKTLSVEREFRGNSSSSSQDQVKPSQPLSSRETYQKKHLSELRNKIIKVNDEKTTETREISSQSSSQKIDESLIACQSYKKIAVRLTYDEKQDPEGTNELLGKKQSFQKFFKKIRKTSQHSYLIRQVKMMGIFGLYHVKLSNYQLIQISNEKILKFYKKMGQNTIITEPYEYSLKQLIGMGKMTPANLTKITNQVENTRKLIEVESERQIVFAPICDIVFYVHGQMKIVPLIKQI